MYKYFLPLLFCALLSTSAFAHIDLIDITKISSDAKHAQQYNFINDNKKYYHSFTPEWTFDKPRAELITQLKEIYTSFAGIKKKNAELYLLLGDVSHYLYNMDVSEYFKLQ